MAEFPLNDPRWTATHVSIEQRKQQTGDLGLALLDSEQSWASGKVRTMRRNRHTGEAELVEASFYETHFIGHVSPTSVIISRQTDVDRHKIDEYGNLVGEPLSDWLFYEWQPDIDGLNSAGASSLEEPLRAIDRAVAGLRDRYPTKAQMPGLKEATRAVRRKCKDWGWRPPSEETVQRAAVQLKYRPPRKGQATPRKR